ncbi:MAG: tripartite tricarboxylate transporter TctB family protein [Hyphomicrobiaceae bacterium]
MKRGWQLASLGLMALFAYAIWLSANLPLIDELGPGPGFFPLWLGIIGLLLGTILIVQVTRAPDDGPSVAELMPDAAAFFRIGAIIVVLAFVTLGFEQVGYRITAFVFSIAVLLALGARSPVAIGIFAVCASFGVFHAFYYWLKVPLPIGTLGI